MSITSIFQKLFGSETDNEQQQPSSSENEGKNLLNDPNLGKRIQAEDDGGMPSNAEDSSFEGSEPAHDEENPSSSETEGHSHEETKVNPEMPDNNEAEEKKPKMAAYNLIILDESGSMAPVRNETISGCNETLNSIRITAKEKQLLSLAKTGRLTSKR